MKRLSYSITDHACQKCGGRILVRAITGAGISGYSSYMCSCCELTESGLVDPPFCYCNLKWRGSEVSYYRCVNIRKELSNAPWLKDACAHSGYDVESGQAIGLVSRAAEKTAADRWQKLFGH